MIVVLGQLSHVAKMYGLNNKETNYAGYDFFLRVYNGMMTLLNILIEAKPELMNIVDAYYESI